MNHRLIGTSYRVDWWPLASTVRGAGNRLIGRDTRRVRIARTYGDALLVFFVLVFVLQIVLIFLIARFADWHGRVSWVEFHALVLFGLGARPLMLNQRCLCAKAKADHARLAVFVLR